jgi:hypothetical protein
LTGSHNNVVKRETGSHNNVVMRETGSHNNVVMRDNISTVCYYIITNRH